MGRLLARLTLLIALLVTLWPADARAGIGNQCVAELASMEAPLGEAGEASLCGEGNLVVRRISHLEVPICLWEGASAIAPLPLIPTDGASAEPTKDCNGFELASEVSRSDDHPSSKSPAPPLHAALLELPSPPSLALQPRRVLSRIETTRRGHAHRRGVYRPPRA